MQVLGKFRHLTEKKTTPQPCHEFSLAATTYIDLAIPISKQMDFCAVEL